MNRLKVFVKCRLFCLCVKFYYLRLAARLFKCQKKAGEHSATGKKSKKAQARCEVLFQVILVLKTSHYWLEIEFKRIRLRGSGLFSVL